MKASKVLRHCIGLVFTLAAAAALFVFVSLGAAYVRGEQRPLRQISTCGIEGSLHLIPDTFLQAVGKLRIQASSHVIRRDGQFTLVSTPDGDWWVPRGSESGLHLDQAEQRRDIYGHVRKGDVVLDCGANIGLYTRQALRQGASLVVAIEPAPDNIECLRRNLSADIRAGRVIIYPKGVWDHDDVLALHIADGDQAADSFVQRSDETTRTINVPLTTVDQLVGELRLPKVGFIKMDIEGAERNALQGARETLRRYRPRMALCVYHLADDPQVIPDVVAKAVPNYHSECRCLSTGYSVFPQVLHMQAE